MPSTPLQDASPPQPPPFSRLPLEIKREITKCMDDVNLICFAVSTKEHYQLVLSVKGSETLIPLVPTIRTSASSSIHLSWDGENPCEQFVCRLWRWLGDRCPYCRYRHEELAKYYDICAGTNDSAWIYNVHPCKAAFPDFGATIGVEEAGRYFQSICHHEHLIVFDIKNWITKRKVSRQALKVLIYLFGKYRCLLRRIEALSVWLYEEPIHPSDQFLRDRIEQNWKDWQPIREEAARECFDSPDHVGYLEMDELTFTLKQLENVSIKGDPRCICQCVAELGRPYTLSISCNHPEHAEAGSSTDPAKN
jgi:hypothetical protein